MRKSISKLTAILLCAAVLVGSVPFAQNLISGAVKAAAANGDDVESDRFLSYNAVPEGFIGASDPYGYGAGRPFPYITQDETFYYKCHNATEYAYVYDKMENAQFGFTESGKVDATYALSGVAALNFTQAVSFDGDGSGRNSYVAIVGVDASQMAKVIIYDTVGKCTVGSTLTLGKMNEISNSTQFYQASNHLSIVAGDFNGDGKDSLVVYATIHDTNSSAYGLFQIDMTYGGNGKVSGASCSVTSGIKNLLNRKYVGENASDTVACEYRADERNKLCVSMAVGDINNDKIDDLVVLSYLGDFKNREDLNFEVTLPYLAVAYGSETRGEITVYNDEGYYVHNGSAGVYETIASPGVAVTNVDGEGGDEVIVAGEALHVETGNGSKYYSDKRTETIRIARYYYSSGKLNRSYLENGEEENTLTKNTIDNSDSVFAQIKVAGVYMNGRGNPAYVFINGDIYDLSNGAERKKLYTYEEINKNPNGRSIQFIYSMAAGNFDHNGQGCEQIHFIVAEKESGEDDYDLYRATVGKNGKNFYGTENLRSDTSTVLADNKGDDLDECLSALVCAVDRDNDGVIAKYNGVDYYYSDPDVIAVLQAGPYFEDIADFYSNNNETTYTLTESRTYEEAKTENISFSVCATLSISAAVVEASVSSGYAMDWTEEFSNSITYEISKSWTAQGEDTVVVYRTPVFVYKYDVQDTSGAWKDSELCMTVEKKPVFTTMTVDEYNDFCDSFNNQQSVKDFNERKAKDGQSDLVYNMVKIDPDKTWLGNEGNPFNYAKITEAGEGYNIFGDLQQPGTSDSSTSVSYSITTEESQTTEIAHGLHFGAACAAGPAVVKVGIETSLDRLSGSASTTSLGKGTAFECNIQNPVKSAMLASGYSDAQCRAYSFSWKLASWSSGIPAAGGNCVPVVGYVLGDVHALAHPPKNLSASAEDTDSDGEKDIIDVSWESNTDGGYPETQKYNVYLIEEDGSRTLIKSNFADTCFRYTITDSRKIHSFAVRGIFDGIETVDSAVDCDTSNDLINIKSIDKVETSGLVDKYKITYTGTKAPTYFYVTNGKDGQDGQTAYEAAVENGYEGTIEQWLEVIGADCQVNGHTFTAYTVPASCGIDGFVLKVCSVCGSAECSKLDALTHSYTSETSEPTCLDMGFTIHKCSNCGDYYIDNFKPALNHKYGVTVHEPDCVNMGYSVYTCERCGESHIENMVPATDHEYEKSVTAPTCTAKGFTTYTCKVCGDMYVSDITDTVEHSFSTKVIESTCVSGGYTIRYCEVCGYQEIVDETAASGHHFEVTSEINATCMSNGYKVYTCKNCGVSYTGDEVPALAHSFEDRVVAPDCAHDGYTIHTCTGCGFSRIDSYTDKTEHTPGEWFCDNCSAGHYVKRCEKCYAKLDEKTVVISADIGDGETNISQGSVVDLRYGDSLSLASGDAEGRAKYVSSDESIAVIDENGEITAVGPGTASITVTDEESGIATTFTVKIEKTWWQKVHSVLASVFIFKALFMLFNISY